MNHSELREITFHGWEEDDDPANKMVRKTWEKKPRECSFLETEGRWYFKMNLTVNVPGATDSQRKAG